MKILSGMYVETLDQVRFLEKLLNVMFLLLKTGPSDRVAQALIEQIAKTLSEVVREKTAIPVLEWYIEKRFPELECGDRVYTNIMEVLINALSDLDDVVSFKKRLTTVKGFRWLLRFIPSGGVPQATVESLMEKLRSLTINDNSGIKLAKAIKDTALKQFPFSLTTSRGSEEKPSNGSKTFCLRCRSTQRSFWP